MQTKVIRHSKNADSQIPKIKQKAVSDIVPTISVLNPFKFEISSENTVDNIPGALLLRSNHATFLYIISLNNWRLTLSVRPSPATVNNNFYIYPTDADANIKPIPNKHQKSLSSSNVGDLGPAITTNIRFAIRYPNPGIVRELMIAINTDR